MSNNLSSKNHAIAKTPTPLERDWIDAARIMLIEGGIAAVQVNPLAARLGVTRGGFYWRFRNRQDLLDHLLLDWRERNTVSFLSAVAPPGSPQERYKRLVDLWLEEKEFDPSLEIAVRQWGIIDKEIATIVREVDGIRIKALSEMFSAAGQSPIEAMVRARILYFHQVGYYTLGIHETDEERRQLMPHYTQILSGFAD